MERMSIAKASALYKSVIKAKRGNFEDSKI